MTKSYGQILEVSTFFCTSEEEHLWVQKKHYVIFWLVCTNVWESGYNFFLAEVHFQVNI